MNKALMLKILGLCLACSLLTGIAVYATAPSNIMTFSGGTFPGAPSYSISKVGSSYYAKNQNGETEFSDALDASNVILDCIEALGTSGGEIRFGKGTYYCYTQLEIDVSDYRNWALVGEEISVDYGLTETFGTILFKRFNGDLFDIYSSTGSNPSYPWKIANMELVGLTQTEFNQEPVPYTGGGLYLHNVNWWEIENLRVTGFEDTLIEVSGSGHCSMRHIQCDTTKNGYGIQLHNTVADAIFYDIESDCNVQPEGKSAFYTTSAVHVVGGHFEGRIGIVCDGTALPRFTNVWVPYSLGNNVFINSTAGGTFVNCIFQDANAQEDYSGYESAQVYFAGQPIVATSFTGCHFGDSSYSDYSVYGAGYVSFIACDFAETMNITSRNMIQGSGRIADVESGGNNMFMGNIFFGDGTYTTTATDYMRGNYNRTAWAWIADTTP